MILSVLLPQGELFRGAVKKVVAEGVGGSRGFLPRHIDFVTVLTPSIVFAVLEDDSERFFAVHGGVLVKKGEQLTVSTRYALMADRLETLPTRIEEAFAAELEQERQTRRVLFQLESHLVKELLEWIR